jgi:hypothetical protein
VVAVAAVAVAAAAVAAAAVAAVAAAAVAAAAVAATAVAAAATVAARKQQVVVRANVRCLTKQLLNKFTIVIYIPIGLSIIRE